MPKLSKRAVEFESPGYAKPHPDKGEERCSDCVHFEPAAQGLGTCEIVVGVMEGGDWCNRFRAKGGRNG